MTPPPMQRSGTVVDARMSLAMWLRAGRSQRNMTLEDVARVTKIQVRILEKLESGAIKTGDGMPADVFVRGFVRSIARCIGLDEAEALRRYTEAATQAALDLSPSTSAPAATASARAFVESMSELAPQAARTTSPRMLASSPSFAAGSLADLPSADEIVLEPAIEIDVDVEVASEAAVAAPVEAAPVEAAPIEAAPVTSASIEVVDAGASGDAIVVEATDGKKKRAKKGTATGKGRKRKAIATGTPFEPMPVVAAATAVDPSALEIAPTEIAPTTVATPRVSGVVNTSEALAFATFVATNPSTASAAEVPASTPSIIDAPLAAASDDAASIAAIVSAVDSTEVVPAGETWSPKMPVVVAPTVPWRLAASAQSLARSKSSTARIVPSMVIDDAHPDLAEREIEDRAAARSPDLAAVRRSFLPPILMDREDRSARQGGLTLAVIILLIAATLTLSYLMRRPSSSGDGVTQAELVESVDQLA